MADQLVALGREVFQRGNEFVSKITGRVDRPLQAIRQFRNRPNPGVVVTVDLLTTGVDIPDLEFIVFLRPVKSRILFEQMLGPGVRGWARNTRTRHTFLVFDCFDGTLLEYFKGVTGISQELPAPPTKDDLGHCWWHLEQSGTANTTFAASRSGCSASTKEMSAEGRELFRCVYSRRRYRPLRDGTRTPFTKGFCPRD